VSFTQIEVEVEVKPTGDAVHKPLPAFTLNVSNQSTTKIEEEKA